MEGNTRLVQPGLGLLLPGIQQRSLIAISHQQQSVSNTPQIIVLGQELLLTLPIAEAILGQVFQPLIQAPFAFGSLGKIRPGIVLLTPLMLTLRSIPPSQASRSAYPLPHRTTRSSRA